MLTGIKRNLPELKGYDGSQTNPGGPAKMPRMQDYKDGYPKQVLPANVKGPDWAGTPSQAITLEYQINPYKLKAEPGVVNDVESLAWFQSIYPGDVVFLKTAAAVDLRSNSMSYYPLQMAELTQLNLMYARRCLLLINSPKGYGTLGLKPEDFWYNAPAGKQGFERFGPHQFNMLIKASSDFTYGGVLVSNSTSTKFIPNISNTSKINNQALTVLLKQHHHEMTNYWVKGGDYPNVYNGDHLFIRKCFQKVKANEQFDFRVTQGHTMKFPDVPQNQDYYIVQIRAMKSRSSVLFPWNDVNYHYTELKEVNLESHHSTYIPRKYTELMKIDFTRAYLNNNEKQDEHIENIVHFSNAFRMINDAFIFDRYNADKQNRFNNRSCEFMVSDTTLGICRKKLADVGPIVRDPVRVKENNFTNQYREASTLQIDLDAVYGI
jgi:hypothetical protein